MCSCHVLCVHSIPRIAHFRLNFPGSCCAPRWLMSEIKFEASGLAQDWDYVEVLRERMRTGQGLLVGTLHELTVQRACKNIDVLTPVLARCAEAKP